MQSLDFGSIQFMAFSRGKYNKVFLSVSDEEIDEPCPEWNCCMEDLQMPDELIWTGARAVRFLPSAQHLAFLGRHEYKVDLQDMSKLGVLFGMPV